MFIDQPREYSLLSNKLHISDVFHKMNSPIKYVCFATVLRVLYTIFLNSELNTFLCWKRIDIGWIIIGNYTSYTKSNFYEAVNVITNFPGQPRPAKCDLSVGLACLWNGLND